MRDLDVKGGTQDEDDVMGRVFPKVENGEYCNDKENGVMHTFEVSLSEQIGR